MSELHKALEVVKVSKSFHDPVTVKVLKEVSLDLARGEFVSIGPEGCGKQSCVQASHFNAYIVAGYFISTNCPCSIDITPCHFSSPGYHKQSMFFGDFPKDFRIF